jgi:hypothetical protein
MNIKTMVMLLAIPIWISPNLIAQENSQAISKITSAIKSSDATALAGYFNTTIDLEAGDSDGNFSKKQAEMIMRDFFKKAPVKSYTTNHNGSSNDGSKYMIGTYKSTNGKSFRVYILLKKAGNNLLINQLQFDEE